MKPFGKKRKRGDWEEKETNKQKRYINTEYNVPYVGCMDVIKMWRVFRKHTHGLEVELENSATETALVTGVSLLMCVHLLPSLFPAQSLLPTHHFGSHMTFFNFISSQRGDTDLIASLCTLPKGTILVEGFASCTFWFGFTFIIGRT